MNRYKGGKTPLLSWYRALVAVLVCACVVVGFMAWNTPQTTDVFAQFASTQTVGGCPNNSPAPLRAADLSFGNPGLRRVNNPDVHYKVSGNSPAEINRQMARCSPATAHSGEFAADTAYVINWQFNQRTAGLGMCTIDAVTVGLVTRHIYPQWHSADASPALHAKWDRFIANLTAHEQGHAALNREYAQHVLQTLRTLPPTDCAGLKEQANAAARQIISELDAAHNAYDKTTDHGRIQGAVLR